MKLLFSQPSFLLISVTLQLVARYCKLHYTRTKVVNTLSPGSLKNSSDYKEVGCLTVIQPSRQSEEKSCQRAWSGLAYLVIWRVCRFSLKLGSNSRTFKILNDCEIGLQQAQGWYAKHWYSCTDWDPQHFQIWSHMVTIHYWIMDFASYLLNQTW